MILSRREMTDKERLWEKEQNEPYIQVERQSESCDTSAFHCRSNLATKRGIVEITTMLDTPKQDLGEWRIWTIEDDQCRIHFAAI